MRAAIIQRLGEPPGMGEAEEPERGPAHALIHVAAAALNPLDLAIASGLHYTETRRFPTSRGARASAS
jgi:NADPH:quinone reductase-like Zn-dependent oxidoreductase